MVRELFTVGLDDTGAPDGDGTSRLGRAWARTVEADGFGQSLGVTRHQLWQSLKIRSTGGNRAIAVVIESDETILDIEDHVVDFVRAHAARRANAAVAVLSRHSDMPHALAFGRRSQQELMKFADAERYASESNVLIRGLGGDRSGMIGALAAAGLRAGGKDGLFIDLTGIRQLSGRVTAGQIRERSALQQIIDQETGEELDRDDLIDTLDWIRPRMVEDHPVLITARSPEERKLWLPVDRRSNA